MDAAREATADRVEATREATAEHVERARLTFRRLAGLDRSGPPPGATVRGAPLRPWTIPNAIGFVRLALIPVFVSLALASDDGRDTAAAIVFAVIAWSDYLDGIAARLTGQYSRLGALLDPFVDRLLIISGLMVCWHFELLPRWALAVVVARELFMLAMVRWGLRHGVDLAINWPGRLAVWPVMTAPFAAMVALETVALVCLYAGMALALVATVLYVREGRRQLRAGAGDRIPSS
jgi:cardiolipin synthase (CMP-forming)